MNLAPWKRNKSAAIPLSDAVRAHLAATRALTPQDAAGLRMVACPGQYSGRKVTYFRVFNPTAVEGAGVKLQHYADLDAHRTLQLHAGHIEADGQIVLNLQQHTPDKA